MMSPSEYEPSIPIYVGHISFRIAITQRARFTVAMVNNIVSKHKGHHLIRQCDETCGS